MAGYALMKAKEAGRRARARASVQLAKREHTIYSTLASAVLGIAEAKGYKLPEVFGIDGTVVAGSAALLVADSSAGNAGRFFQSFGDGMLAIGAYKMGRAVGGKRIEGMDDVQAIEAVLSST